MTSLNIVQGALGEEHAASFLKKLGYRILERNYKARYGEIDIVALSHNTLVFVEVKTRSSFDYGNPLEAITPWKLKTLIKTAEFYKLTHRNLPSLMRIDAVSVELGAGGLIKNIEHIENISGF